MIKVLEYWPENEIAPKGGPRGYLYNLREGLRKIADTDYQFSFLPPNGSDNILRSVVRKYAPKRLRDIKRLRKILNYPYHTTTPRISFDQYDIVHFHQVEDLYFAREALRNYQGKVLLTSHTPCAPQDEWISRLDHRDVIKHTEALEKLSDISEYAFDHADVIIFPTPTSEEPYFNTWRKYSEIKARNSQKYAYILTGIQDCAPNIHDYDLRKKLGIPDQAKVISYVGRHNRIKGYDRLVKISSKLLSDPNVWVLVAGKESSIKPPKSSRWIEFGWTDDPYSIINSSDLFVLPNRETYFDLALLEVLSLRKPVITTFTGGNKIFESLTPNGISLAKDDFEILEMLKTNVERTREDLAERGELNRVLYEEYFTSSVFAKNYLIMLKKILG